MSKIGEKIKRIKRIGGITRYLLVGISLLFGVYRLAVNTGSRGLDIAILVMSLAYLGLLIWDTHAKNRSDGQRLVSAIGKPLYRMVKLLLLTFSVFLSAVSVVNAVEHTGFLSVLLCVLLIFFLIFQVFIDGVVLLLSISLEKVRRTASKKWSAWKNSRSMQDIEDKKLEK